MSRKLLAGLALVAGPLLWGSAANADMIGIGGATGSITFTSNGDGTIKFHTDGFTSTGLTSFQHPTGVGEDTGNSTFGAMDGSTSIESGNLFYDRLGWGGDLFVQLDHRLGYVERYRQLALHKRRHHLASV